MIFMHACGREVQFLPALDGSGFIPWGQIEFGPVEEEMTYLIEFMFAWGRRTDCLERSCGKERRMTEREDVGTTPRKPLTPTSARQDVQEHKGICALSASG